MKRPKSLTREQKIAVSAAGYLPDSWQLVRETEFYLIIAHKLTGVRRTIDKYAVPKKGGNDEFRSHNHPRLS